MKAAGCEMDDSPCVGHKLIPMRAMNQLNGDLSKLSREEKGAKEKWKLVPLTKNQATAVKELHSYPEFS